MAEQKETPAIQYEVIRSADHAVVAKIQDLPDFDRALAYKNGNTISFVPLQPTEIVGTLSLFTQILERAGYRACPPDKLQ